MKKFTEYNTVLDSIPEEGPLNGIRSDLDGIELDPPIDAIDSDSWGSYIKKYGWVSSKVFTGKAIREWILSKFKTKLEVSSISVSEGSLQPPADKRFITLNKAITISDSSGESIIINLPVLVEAEAIKYPTVWFSELDEYNEPTGSGLSGSSFTKNVSTRHYWVIVQNGVLTKVVNSLNFDYTNRFKRDESITDYNVYHYERDIDDVTITLTFTFYREQ